MKLNQIAESEYAGLEDNDQFGHSRIYYTGIISSHSIKNAISQAASKATGHEIRRRDIYKNGSRIGFAIDNDDQIHRQTEIKVPIVLTLNLD